MNNIRLMTPSGTSLTVTPDAFRLMLLGWVDFAADWDGLVVAADFVVDGQAKVRVLTEQVRPLVDVLPAALGGQVDAIVMLAARHWLRNEPLRS